MLVLFALAAALPFAGPLEGQVAQIKNQHFKAFEPFAANSTTVSKRSTGDNAHSVRLAQDFHPAAPKQDTPFQAKPTYKTVATNLRGFGVPFQINADNGSFIEVQLYVSRDMGKTWQFAARQSTDQKEFPFQAEEDGEYWFALKTLNRDRKLIPEGDPQIDLKIVVDTVKPEFDFRVETDAAGRIACRWRATDQNIAPQSLRIFYQPIDVDGKEEAWKQVPIKLSGTARAGIYADQLAWWPETTQRAVNVAVEIKDFAGNAVQLTRQVLVTQAGWRHQQKSTAQITDVPPKPQNNWTMPDVQDSPPPVPESTIPPAGGKVAQNNHPPNVVCKDGVCQIVKAPITSRSAGLGANPKYSQRPPPQQRPMKLVGSEVDFAAPPIPEGYDPANAISYMAPPIPDEQSVEGSGARHFANRHPGHKAESQVWQSETDNWNLRTQSSSATTMQPDPSLAPDPFSDFNSPPRPVTDVPSNHPTMTTKGDQVIGESSTMGATNQYRGLNSQTGRTIPKSTLLPGVDGGLSRSSEANSDQNLQKSFSQPKSLSNIGYRSRSSSSPTRDVMPTRESKAPIQIIGSKRFRLNYGIDSIDPSGVARVDLWLTRDDGKTWQAWGSDPDNQSPFPVEVRQEGRFGFRIVVHSKDGLTGQGPASGDDPDMWILVDTQSPLARITSVPYGRGNEAGRLVVNYSVSDKFLTLRPIVLAYSSNPQGPWDVIGEGLRNEGRFVWKPTPDVPDRIFLRIDALDKAGNVGVHVLSQAIDVSGLVPRGTIHGVVPVGKR